MNKLFILDNLRYGGGKVLGVNYLKEALKDRRNYFLLPNEKEYIDMVLKNKLESRIIYYSIHTRKERFSLIKILEIRKFIKFKNIEIIINFSNIPLIGMRTNQYLMIHKAHLVLPINNEYLEYPMKQKFRLFLEKNYIKYAVKSNFIKGIILQTKFMKQNYIGTFGNKADVMIVQSGHNKLSEQNIELRTDQKENELSLFVPTSEATHKNNEYIFRVAKAIIEKGYSVKWYITLPNKSPFKDYVSKYDLSKNIQLVGKLSSKDMDSYYIQSNAVFLPTLLESFCLPYVEGIINGNYIFTSDLPFAKEVCRENGIYFDPHNRNSATQAIIKFIEDGSPKNDTSIHENPYLISWKESYQLLMERIEG